MSQNNVTVEWTGLAVTIYICIGEEFGSKLGRNTDRPEIFILSPSRQMPYLDYTKIPSNSSAILPSDVIQSRYWQRHKITHTKTNVTTSVIRRCIIDRVLPLMVTILNISRTAGHFCTTIFCCRFLLLMYYEQGTKAYETVSEISCTSRLRSILDLKFSRQWLWTARYFGF
jgi:hypothetical protein